MSQMSQSGPGNGSSAGDGGKHFADLESPIGSRFISHTINGVVIEDTYAEAFDMTATRVVITAATQQWALRAAESMTGFATSIIACKAEAGIERFVDESETPDNRPGVAVLLFSINRDALQEALVTRAGQCVLTCPSTSVFTGINRNDRPISLGGKIRHFGDGYQISKQFGTERYWRIPVMDGEFVCQERVYTTKGVGGGNFLVLAEGQSGALQACEAAVQEIRKLSGCIAPFPGGVVRSGSKVGSKYKGLRASTNDAYCPTLVGQVAKSAIPDGVGACLEIVIDGLTPEIVAQAISMA